MTSDDVTWPVMPLRGVAGAKFHLNRQWWAYWTCSWAYLLKIMLFKGIWNFSHWLIMGRSWNWPDLRSQKSKIQDIRFVGRVTLTDVWEFHMNRFIVVALAWVQTFSEVGLFDLTWWPDLRWPGVGFCTPCAKKMPDKVCQVWRRCAPPFFCYPRKTWGGGGVKPSPRPGAG